jgi:hypothetical protein
MRTHTWGRERDTLIAAVLGLAGAVVILVLAAIF